MRRGLLDRLDHPASEAGPGLDDPNADAVAGDSPRHEDHITVGSANPLPAHGEVVDGQGQSIAALRTGHAATL
jgi:hypothetical protein